MKSIVRILFLLLFLGHGFYSRSQVSYNTKLLGRWSNDSLPMLSNPENMRFNELWGYYDSARSREYIIMGSIDSVYFFDVTNPASIKLCDVEAGRVKGCINRDFQTYSHYAYAVSDQGKGSLQVFDLQYLPDSVHKVYDSDTLGFRTHTICVYKNIMFMCLNNIASKGLLPMRVVSLAKPDSPAFLADFKAPIVGGNPLFDQVHDMIIVDDTAYLSCGNAGLFVYDFRNPLAPVYVNSLQVYPEKGYNHNSWKSNDKKHLIFTDENQGLGVKLYDISDPLLPRLKSVFRSHTGAMAHNPFIKGNNTVYISYYQDGVYMFDFTVDTDPKVLAYYDTYPENTAYTGFQGCWGVYPYLPSGNVFASDMTHGLFALRMNTTGIASAQNEGSLSLHPNPAHEATILTLFSPADAQATVRFTGIDGKTAQLQTVHLQYGKNQIRMETCNLAPGMYEVQVVSDYGVYNAKFVTK